MYGHGDYGKETKDVGEPISNVIPLDLEYACLNWVRHLESSQQCVEYIDEEDRSKVLLHQMSSVVEEVQTWLEEHLLHWIEALSLLGRLSDGISSIRQLRFILQSSFDADPDFDAFLADAERFALSYGFIIERFPLQIYSAALTFCPTDSEMNRRLGAERYSDIPILRGARIGWDHCLYTLKGHGASVNAVAYSSRHKVLASASSDRTIRLWDDVAGAHKRTLQGHSGYVLDVAFSPDGNTLASASSDGTVWIWGVDKGSHIRTLEGHSSWVNSVAFLSDSTLASASSDGTVRLWDISEGICKDTDKSHNGPVNSVASARNGMVLASGSSDRTVHVWNFAKEPYNQEILSHDGPVTAVSFSPDGDLLASASGNWTVRVWHADTRSQVRTLEGYRSVVNSVTFINSDKLAIIPRDGTLRIWEPYNNHMQKLEGRGGWLNSTVFLAERNVLVAASSDRTLRVLDGIIGGAEKMCGHDGPVNAVVFSPDGTWLASTSSDWTVRLWNAGQGTCVRTIHHQKRITEDQRTIDNYSCYILSIAFSPNGKIIASGCSDWSIRLWDVDKGTLIKTLTYKNPPPKPPNPSTPLTGKALTPEDQGRFVLAIAFSPDGMMIASGSSDWRVRLWNTFDKYTFALATLEGHRNWVRAVAFSTDGKLLASASTDGMLWLWDVEKRNNGTSIYEDSASNILRERCCDVNESTHQQDWVRTVAFSPDGKELAWALTDGTVSFLPLDFDQVRSMRACDSLAVAFSLDEYPSVAYHYVYRKLRDYLRKHLEQVVGKSKARTGEELLTFYNQEWSRYIEAAKYTNNLLQYLQRTLIEQNIDKSTEGIYDVYTLYLIQWQFVILGSISGKIIEVVLKLIERGRNGEIIENGIIKRVVESFISLGIDPDDPSLTTLWTYRFYFEKQFLEATKQYYRKTSKHYLAEKGVVEYMRWAELRLDEEDELLRICLHYDTTGPLRDACTQVLVTEHSEVLEKNFQSLLDDGREEDMARTVNFLAHVPFGLAPLRLQFETRLRKAGLAAVVKISKLEPKIYVGPVCTQYHDLVRWASNEDMQWTRSSNDVCRELISQHDDCEMESDGFSEPFSEYNTELTEAEGPTDVISITEDWIARDGCNLLCLPPDYRATCAARWNNVLVLGHRSGRVSFFQLP
ncbi:WD repeat-containing protein, putative [Metarhizium acridum CQMa 102]|uniref:WD repeat-containing protein, putative n=1 Tax=Metarhizium acridum (strain CQMa 102) TaxID=655827 RepID=E9EEZ0_METAQ|nr:WD repeat-containing protein, putative [Metarhizium acridum CQMa 102]EFY85491.1 WD repeat-containing protein, putative [Metarhizium acridum CQMa 102]